MLVTHLAVSSSIAIPQTLKIIEENAAYPSVLLPHVDVEVIIRPLLETRIGLC